MIKIADNLYAFQWESMSRNNCNTYLIDGPKRILIDPGHSRLFQRVSDELSALGIRLDDIDVVACTHGHPDHMEAVSIFSGRKTGFALHKEEWRFIQSMDSYVQKALGVPSSQFSPDFFLTEGEHILGDVPFQVLHTPGHSPGSICLYWPEHQALFTGDLVFNRGIGRTDLPGGNSGDLKKSIGKASKLPAEMILPGHGEIISGKTAVSRNFEYLNQVWFGV